MAAIKQNNSTFTVTYNGNGSTGGSVPTDNNNYQQGASVTVAGNVYGLYKNNYTFAGWNTVVMAVVRAM